MVIYYNERCILSISHVDSMKERLRKSVILHGSIKVRTWLYDLNSSNQFKIPFKSGCCSSRTSD